MKKAVIRENQITVKEGQTKVYFSGGGSQGTAREQGWFNFWTAQGEDEFGDWKVIVRALEHLSPDDRFLRMDLERNSCPEGESRAAYRLCWERFETIKSIRPSNVREVVKWFNSHEDDAKYADPFVHVNEDKKILPRDI